MTDGNAPATEAAAGPAHPAASPNGSQLPWGFQFTVAAVLIAAFVVLAVLMLSWADAPDGVWKNRVFVFSSVEAIVFTAVGWIFGREVHRSQAVSARKDAAEAKEAANKKADEAAQERAKGMRLAGAVESFTAGADAGGQARDVGLEAEHPEPGGRSAQVASLHDLVHRLYG